MRARVCACALAPPTLLITCGDQSLLTRVELDGIGDVFEFALPSPPEQVVLDPDGGILEGDAN